MPKKKISSLTDIISVSMYLNRIGAKVRSIRTAVVEEKQGKYWTDLAVIRFNRDGSIRCNVITYAPTKAESDAIGAEIRDEIEFPNHVRIDALLGPDVPTIIRDASKENVYEFRGLDGKIDMVQVRITLADGGKKYIPFTFWDDGIWRAIEPEGPLPIYGLDTIKHYSTVFIHEGAKAAASVRKMVEARDIISAKKLANHPWGLELSNAAHVGWIGGALSPDRTDWSALGLNGIKHAYIVADNDIPGRAATPKIAKHLNIPTFAIVFDKKLFPPSFDLGDEFPNYLFEIRKGSLHYIGPSFHNLLSPATWATNTILMQTETKQPFVKKVIRHSFSEQWYYIANIDMVVNHDIPNMQYPPKIFNNEVRPFSDVKDTHGLLVESYKTPVRKICYRPDLKHRIVNNNGVPSLNAHMATKIKSVAGPVEPWMEYLNYMFPSEQECYQVQRWLATLIAKPEVRMGFGLLLVSETQGIGKTTLGEAVLKPLVGDDNISFPSDSDINSDFNDWIAYKRLIFINEIYQGASWTTYHKLKAKITDAYVHVNRKFERTYQLDNWAHVIACSNSSKALRVEHGDRRWFYPRMNEKPWPREKFAEFRFWLRTGGLGYIKCWAENFGDWVLAGEAAPTSVKKDELIEISRSEEQMEAVYIANAMVAATDPVIVTMREVRMRVKQTAHSKFSDTDADLRRSMVETGCRVWGKRVKMNRELTYIIMNQLAWDELTIMVEADQTKRMRQLAVGIDKLLEEPM